MSTTLVEVRDGGSIDWMTRAGTIARVHRLAVALLWLAGCSGESVRLGDVESGGAGAKAAGGEGGIVAAGGSNAGEGGRPVAAGSAGVTAEGGSAGDGENPCLTGTVAANEVLWIGDSWITMPGTQRSRLRDLARAAGVLAEDEDYESRAAAAKLIAEIAEQYEAQQAVTPVKVLLMNGGTWDTIVDGDNAETVARVMSTFEQFLSKAASDGSVEHIVYFLQPELPTIAGVATLRPLLRDACAASAVPCHFLDLNPLWQGHEDEYTDDFGIQASDAGGVVIAEAIWEIMQQNCIAQ